MNKIREDKFFLDQINHEVIAWRHDPIGRCVKIVFYTEDLTTYSSSRYYNLHIYYQRGFMPPELECLLSELKNMELPEYYAGSIWHLSIHYSSSVDYSIDWKGDVTVLRTNNSNPIDEAYASEGEPKMANRLNDTYEYDSDVYHVVVLDRDEKSIVFNDHLVIDSELNVGEVVRAQLAIEPDDLNKFKIHYERLFTARTVK